MFSYLLSYELLLHTEYSNQTRSFRYQHTFIEGFVCSLYKPTKYKEQNRERKRERDRDRDSER